MPKSVIISLSILNNKLVEFLKFYKNSTNVAVYLININNYKQKIPLLWQYLSNHEQSQANKYYYRTLTDKYIVRHGILRCILSYYTHHLPQTIQFNYNKYQKPFLKNNNIQFNMSYSHEMISYIIAIDNQVGIDIELHDNNLNIEELSSLVFTSTEYQYFSKLSTKQKYQFFYNIWTQKESLVKALGQGLSYPINTIDIIGALPNTKIYLKHNNNSYMKGWYSFPLIELKNYSGFITTEREIKQIIYLKDT